VGENSESRVLVGGHTADAVLWGTGLNCGTAEKLGCVSTQASCSGMGAEENTVPGLQCDESLEDNSGGRVGHRNDSSNGADRFSNPRGHRRNQNISKRYPSQRIGDILKDMRRVSVLCVTGDTVLVDDAARLHVLVLVVHKFGSEMILDYFVFNL
jgi:hypothetical protein